jgi:hypothetical protein
MTYIDDYTFAENFEIHPNPTSGIFTITGDNILEIEIRNIFGELIYHNSSPAVDISNQLNGIYLIKISTDKGTVTKKIIKNGL